MSVVNCRDAWVHRKHGPRPIRIAGYVACLCSTRGSVRIPALEGERDALQAEGDALQEEHVRLRFSPVDSPDHAAHKVRLRKHQERLRAYIRALRNQPHDK